MGFQYYRIKQVMIGLLALVVIFVTTASSAFAVSGIRDTEIELMLRAYANPLLQAAGINPASVEIYILNDPSVNAFVTRGDSMYFHTGLLLDADRPAQVVGVMAHEIGHIKGGHVARMGDAFKAASTPMLVTMGLGLLAAIAGAPDAGMAIMSSGQHIAERTILKHSRVQESAADQSAVTLLTQIGQSAEGLLEVTEKFRHMEVLSARNQNPYVRTHPLSSDRVAALRNRVSTSPYAGKREPSAELFAFDMMQAKLYAFINRPDLTFRKYPASQTNLPARYARAIAHFQDANIDAALTEIEALIAAQPGNAYFHELAGQILFETGRAQQSIPYHQKSVDLMPNAALLRINLAQAQLATENKAYTDDAIIHLNKAIQFEQGNSFAWYQLATAYARKNNIGLADLATAERFYHNRQLPQAMQFAIRAKNTLPPGTPQWQRALDIIQVATLERPK